MPEIYNIAVLITCHNRKTKTLHCLEALYRQQGFNIDFKMGVFLVDDGCTDDTANEIMSKYPAVNIISGDGNLYWNRGMHLAWQTASKTKEYDYYLWLNDDTFLFENAILTLLRTPLKMRIICGTTHSIKNKIPTYGGHIRSHRRPITPNGVLQECDSFSGNCVLIPNEVFKLVGNLDEVFHHAIGDTDYGLRAKHLGVKLFVAPEFTGICELNYKIPQWFSPSESLIVRIKSLYMSSTGNYATQFFIFDRRHHGLLIAIFHFFSIHLRVVFPFLWKNNLNK